MLDWFQAHPGVLWGLGAFSLFLFVISLVLVPWFLIRIPSDFFLRDPHQPTGIWMGHPVARHIWWWTRNILGGLLAFTGLCLLLLPGQGLLTLFVGFIVMNFPGKQRLERKILSYRVIHGPIDRLRKKAGKSPLQLRVDAD